MRKMEWLPWILVAIAASCLMVYFMSGTNPDAYTPITVEITGLAIAFFLAISVSELIKTKDKQDRRIELIDSLLEEIKTITGVVEPTALMNIDMWSMAITSGELSILDKQTRSEFRKFYVLVSVQRDMRATLFASAQAKNPEMFKGFSTEIVPIYNTIREVGVYLLEKYST